MQGYDLVVCCVDNLSVRRTLYNSDVKWLDLRAQGRNAAFVTYDADPKMYDTLLAIKEADIIEDWSLSIKLSDGERTMKGLKKINIEKFKSLSGNILENLNTTGGLDICFANILSLNNIENLRQILISKTQSIQKNKEISENKSLRDLTLEKQSKEKKEEMDNLVKNLLLED